MHRYGGWRLVVMFALVVAVAGGCRRTGTKTTGGTAAGGDVLEHTGLEYDLVMGDRPFEEGTRVNVAFDNVLFGYNQYQIEPYEAGTIESVAQYMRDHGDVRLVAEGHCDERGTREYNLALGEHRAQAVRAYLISLGISGDRIQTRSYGEERPLDAGHNESAWRVNRRVEFALYQ